jgi:hypothetical protein
MNQRLEQVERNSRICSVDLGVWSKPGRRASVQSEASVILPQNLRKLFIDVCLGCQKDMH